MGVPRWVGCGFAALVSFLVGIALPGSLYTLVLTTMSASAQFSTGVNSGSLFTGLGPALLLSAIGAATIIFMTGRTRDRDNALVTVGGGTPGALVASVLWEAVIYVFTALLLALFVFIITGGLWAYSLGKVIPGTTLVLGLPTAMSMAGIGFVIIAPATAIPTVVPQRRTIPQLLTVE